MQKQINEFKGFSLFNEMKDEALRNRNRAVVMANITEDNLTSHKRITPKGAVLVLGYFTALPENERAVALELYEQQLQQRGFTGWTH